MDNYNLSYPILGEGSFGQVFIAQRKSDNEIVALKLIKKVQNDFLFISENVQ